MNKRFDNIDDELGVIDKKTDQEIINALVDKWTEDTNNIAMIK